MYSAFFFDMDGVLFNSMPNHAKAWDAVMRRHGLNFSAYDTYINEGRTGKSIINECYYRVHGTDAPDEIWQQIYKEKSEMFEQLGAAGPIDGISDLLYWLRDEYQPTPQIWIVTGSGQHTLFARLNKFFPGVFTRERMITAADVKQGKPDPEPYLKAWERSGCTKNECCVIENAPLGVRSAVGAGLHCMAVNTGILSREDLNKEHPDLVFDDMHQLLEYLKTGG